MKDLIAGDLVYRVVSHVRNPDADFTWVVQARQIKVITHATVQLNRPFSGMGKIRFERAVIGNYFFEDELSAVRDFAVKQRRNAESAERMKREAEDAVRWAEAWGRENVPSVRIVEQEQTS